MKRIAFSLIFTFFCLLICQSNSAFAQDDKTIVKKQPPKVIRYVKPATKYKRKKKKLKRKVDLSKVPRLIKAVKNH